MRKFRNDRELRAWVAQKAGWKDVPQGVWREVSQDRKKVLRLVDSGERALATKELVEQVKDLRKLAERLLGQRQIPGRPTEPIDVDHLLEESEVLRARVVAEEIAKRAARMEAVRSFRATYLGGCTISDESVATFRDSPIPRLLGARELEDSGITLVGHRFSDMPDEGGSGDARQVSVRVTGPGSGSPMLSFDAEVYSSVADLATIELPGSPPFFRPKPTRFMPRSVLDELKRTASVLVRAYCWTESDSVRFILTGHPPSMPGANVSVRFGYEGQRHVRTTIATSAPPWVRGDTIGRIHDAQRRRLGRRGARRIGSKGLEVFEFVERHRNSEGRRPSWRTLLPSWNRKYPKLAFSDASAMRRAYVRVQARLFPG